MAATTTAIIALGGLGMSAAQYAQANKRQKQADKATKQFTEELKSLNRVNNFKSLGVPTMGFDLAKESQAQSTAASLEALKSMGAEGAALVPRVAQQNLEQDLKLSSQLEQAQNRRDVMVANEQSAIDAENLKRREDILSSQAKGAAAASLEARNQKTKAIQGMVSSAVSGLNAVNPAGTINTGGVGDMMTSALSTNNDPTQGRTSPYNSLLTLEALDEQAQEGGFMNWSVFSSQFPKATESDFKDYLLSGIFPDGTTK